MAIFLVKITYWMPLLASRKRGGAKIIERPVPRIVWLGKLRGYYLPPTGKSGAIVALYGELL